MKRFVIFLLTGFIFSFLTEAQQLTPESIERRLNRNDGRLEHPRRGVDPATWVERGEIFQDIYDVNIQFLYFGMSEEELKIFMGNPIEEKIVDTDRGVRNVLVYDNVETYFDQGELVGWLETNVLHENALDEAYSAFNKAIELDERGRQERRIQDAFTRLSLQYIGQAVIQYDNADYNSALHSFKQSVKIGDSPYFTEPLDTGLIFNTGFVAYLAGEYDEALDYLTRVKEMEFGGGELFVMIKDIYVEKNDSLSAEKILQEGFEKYPEENDVIIELVNFYINANNAHKALDYLNLAKEQDPNNYSLHFAEGTLYDRLGETENAKQSYQRSIDINPVFFDVNYNMGVLYYNQAVRLLDEANEITDNAEYEKARDNAFTVLEDAIPYLEQAHEINPKDEYVMETLRILYYRLGVEDKLDEINRKLGRETLQ